MDRYGTLVRSLLAVNVPLEFVPWWLSSLADSGRNHYNDAPEE